jgi:hypothetical protein
MSKSYENAISKKMKNIFLGKKIEKCIQLFDESRCLIDNTVYFRIDGVFWGFYVNGCGPFVSSFFVDDLDSFDLYSLYEDITSSEMDDFRSFYVETVELFMDSEYNDFHGVLLNGDNLLFGIIFLDDEISLIFPQNRDEFVNNIGKKLIHVNINILRIVK